MGRLAPTAVVAAWLLVGCSSVPVAQRANDEGNVAYYARDFDAALARYEHALDAALRAGDTQYAAIAMFGMARTYAQRCDAGDADAWFRKSIAAREALPDIRHAHLTQNQLEYGRFLASWSRDKEAVLLYDRAMPVLESKGMAQSDPVGGRPCP